MLCKYHATIEIPENVDPWSGGQMEPPQGNIIILTASVIYTVLLMIHNCENTTTNETKHKFYWVFGLKSNVGQGEVQWNAELTLWRLSSHSPPNK